MRKMPMLNRFLPYGESKMSIQEFLFNTAGARKSKYGVSTFTNRGEILVFFTFASSLQNAFRKAKSAYKASPYPKVGVGSFMVHGTCQSTTCRCGGGDWLYKYFHVDWANSR